MAWGTGNLGGGTGALNFRVVTGEQPVEPKENTLWVDTDVEIKKFSFSAVQPESAEDGELWVYINKNSEIEFNILKKNSLQVSPLFAQQYIEGAWQEKAAKFYQNGAWLDLEIASLFDNGTQFVTWTSSGYDYSEKSGRVLVAPGIGETLTTSVGSASSSSPKICIVGTDTKIDLTNINKIYVEASSVVSGYSYYSHLYISTQKDLYENSAVRVAVSEGEFFADVSALSGEYYIAVATLNASQLITKAGATITKVWRSWE